MEQAQRWEGVTPGSAGATNSNGCEQGLSLALHGDLARDSAGQVCPRYEYRARRVGHIGCGEFVFEPALGEVAAEAVAVAAGETGSSFVRIQWMGLGPCRALARYHADVHLPVRGPSTADRLVIQRGIDQATYKGRDLAGNTARLIAAHLHAGPGSELYRFAVNGALSDGLFAELDDAAQQGFPPRREWAAVLTRYGVNRADADPVPGWGPVVDEWEEKLDATQPRAAAHAPAHSDRVLALAALDGEVFPEPYLPTETAVRLV